MNEIHGSSCIAAFQISDGDMSSNTFAVCLKIKQQHRISRVKKKSSVVQQLQSVGANTMH